MNSNICTFLKLLHSFAMTFNLCHDNAHIFQSKYLINHTNTDKLIKSSLVLIMIPSEQLRPTLLPLTVALKEVLNKVGQDCLIAGLTRGGDRYGSGVKGPAAVKGAWT